jgi:predicted nucleic acid-binding protein
MPAPLYLDTSAVLRATLESGTTPKLERRIASAPALLTSRLALVESARALHRLRRAGELPESSIAEAESQIARLWRHCEIWELTTEVCELAERVAPAQPLRTLGALHLATYLLARQHFDKLELLTADRRMATAAGSDPEDVRA